LSVTTGQSPLTLGATPFDPALERQIVDVVTDLLIRLDNDGKIVKRTRKIYTMMLFGILNFSHTWYDPNGGVDPQEFADMVVDQFLYGFSATPAAEVQTAMRRRRPS